MARRLTSDTHAGGSAPGHGGQCAFGVRTGDSAVSWSWCPTGQAQAKPAPRATRGRVATRITACPRQAGVLLTRAGADPARPDAHSRSPAELSTMSRGTTVLIDYPIRVRIPALSW